MTVMQEQAYEMIKRLPDDKLYYIIRLLEGLEGLFPSTSKDNEISVEQKAYENLQRFRKCSDVELDYKAELARAVEERYASID